jgi:hypothetical protein
MPLWRLLRTSVQSFAGGAPLKTFEVTSDSRPNSRWTPNGRAIIYNLTNGGPLSGVTNLWTQSLDGGPPKQLTNFTSDTSISTGHATVGGSCTGASRPLVTSS